MGNAACGKSCLIKRYCEEKVQKYISTIGVDFGVKSVVVDNQQESSPETANNRHLSCLPSL
jgi:DnaJ family protein C protein 27